MTRCFPTMYRGRVCRWLRAVAIGACLMIAPSAFAQDAAKTQPVLEPTKKNVPYAESPHERQVLDIYVPQQPAGAKGAPVVFWIHGGGWQVGDKTQVALKPEAFTRRGFVFVSTNYRLLPHVDMGTLIRDVAKSLGWVHKHIAEHGGDPEQILVMGHSAGAQLAAILCTDHRYLQAEGVPFTALKGCVPVDGDTYDIPAIIETAETRRRVHKQPQAKYGHREKFGIDPAKHVDFSAVTHIAPGKGIPPFLIVYVNSHPDTSAQADRLGSALREAKVPVTMYGGKETNHSKINDDLGLSGDPGTIALYAFVDQCLAK
jgi:arylformamidase